MSENTRDDGFGDFDYTREQAEDAAVNLDEPDATDDVPWSPPESQPLFDEGQEDSAGDGETIDERIAQEEPELGTAYGAPETPAQLREEGVTEDVVPGTEEAAESAEMLGGDDPDAIAPEEDVYAPEP
ncbi:hypothetical protein ACQBAT_06195 [Ornithinimicrobium sp. Y1847]|uniref:hypothetical protein n=1 Tax=unclassified Ornithinimicrobium TaxID=2615080 RepID=UPI003B67BC8E